MVAVDSPTNIRKVCSGRNMFSNGGTAGKQMANEDNFDMVMISFFFIR